MKNLQDNTRSRKSLLNVGTAIFSHVFLTFISFFTSRAIKDKLGIEILGLNGVFANVISILSLAELGFGSAINFALYKPLAENNEQSIKSIMHFYKKAYRIIALVVLIIGLIIMPFITIIAKSNLAANYIYVSYFLFLINSVFSYLLVYKRTIIIADQKNYIVTSCTLIYSTVLKVTQLLVVIFTSNYFLFLSVNIICTLLLNIYISIIADRLYPFLRDKNIEPLDRATHDVIVSKIKALFLHSLGSVIVFGTDNILVSYFAGISDAGRYTSYVTIINMVGVLITTIFDNLRDSVGNYLLEKNRDEQLNLFFKLVYLCHSLVYICAICLVILIPPFMTLWLGKDIVLNQEILYAMILSFIVLRTRSPVGTIKSAAGLFEQDKYAGLIEAFVNLIASILIARKIGILGVVLGTVISTLFVPFLVQPYVVFKNLFKKKVITYYLVYARDFLLFLGSFLIVNFITNLIFDLANCTFIWFVLTSLFVFISSSGVWLFSHLYSEQQKFYLKLLWRKINA